jgi:hypothetical protein
MPLFRYKLGLDDAVRDCISKEFLSIPLELPVRRCRRLDDLAALRLDPNRGAVRGAISERVRRWAQQHLADSEVGVRESLEQIAPLTALAIKSEFVIGLRLEVVRLCGQPEAPSRYLIAASMG